MWAECIYMKSKFKLKLAINHFVVGLSVGHLIIKKQKIMPQSKNINH